MPNRPEHWRGNANPLIDTALNELPPAKRVRWAEGQRYRKITVAELINGRMLSAFVNGWLAHCTAIESADQSSTADTFPALCDAAADIIDAVLNVADTSGFSHEQFQWKMTAADGRLEVCHLVALHDWLVSTNLMVGDIQKKPAPSAKKGIFSPMAQCVRLSWGGREKCITCDTGPRGKALDNRPMSPRADHPYLAGCKCPLRGAALELRIIKQTAWMKGIPQRGGDDDIKAGRLALNPDILKVIAGAIQVVSGHGIKTLLQPEEDRLEHPILWALDRLKAINEDSRFSRSFDLLAKKLRETLQLSVEEDST
ncbi:hypothetical protein FB451DRAFT_1180723 [Mycena latifolia]|nr:hypothetical protein FB451DRAFT_1180723 [Mycena latifolia]